MITDRDPYRAAMLEARRTGAAVGVAVYLLLWTAVVAAPFQKAFGDQWCSLAIAAGVVWACAGYLQRGASVDPAGYDGDDESRRADLVGALSAHAAALLGLVLRMLLAR